MPSIRGLRKPRVRSWLGSTVTINIRHGLFRWLQISSRFSQKWNGSPVDIPSLGMKGAELSLARMQLASTMTLFLEERICQVEDRMPDLSFSRNRLSGDAPCGSELEAT